jgi:hypothetical protein
MHKTSRSLAFSCALAALACGTDPPAGDTDGSSGEPNTESAPQTSNSSPSTTEPETSTGETTGDETTTGGSVSTSLSDTGDTTTTGNPDTTTGNPGDCVDEDIAGAVGKQVANGNTANAGDDFPLFTCSGGGGSTSDWGSGFVSFVGSDDGMTFIVPPDTDGGGGSSGSGGWDTSGGVVTSFGDTGVWESSGGEYTGDDYVIEWTPPESMAYTLSLQGSSFDTLLAVAPPECGAETFVCNDDCYGVDSALVFDATQGETVYIVVTGYQGQTGNFVLHIFEGGGLDCGGGDTDTDTATDTSPTTGPGTMTTGPDTSGSSGPPP